jgi:hypothetical protein
MTEHEQHRHPEHRSVVILVNNRDVEVPEDVTGLQIKQAADVPVTFKLFDPRGDEIPNDKRIHVHKGERFTAISGQDVS